MERSRYSLMGAIALLIASTPISAVIIFDGNYVRAAADVDAGSGPSSGGDFLFTGASFADTGVIEFTNGAFSASGHAVASIGSGGPSFKAISSSTAPQATGLFSTSSSTFVRSSWRDILLPDMAGAPSSLNFNFSVHALLEVSQTVNSGILGNGNFSTAGISVIASDNINSFSNSTLGTGLSARVSSLNGDATTTQVDENSLLTWDATQFTSLGLNKYEFNGSFTYNAQLLTFFPTEPDAPFGAYFLGVGLSSITSNVGGTSTSDAFNTLTLDSITLSNGEVLPDGINFNFESGTSLASVPLPPSWLLMLSAIAFGATCKRQKSSR